MGVYERLDGATTEDLLWCGHLISSAFTIWQGDAAERRARFVVNFSRQSKFWAKGSVKMERMEELVEELKP